MLILSLLTIGAAASSNFTQHGFRTRIPGRKAPDSQDNQRLERFEQLIDHSDPSRGTFSQRYWYDMQYWKGPGSPIVLFTPGEENAVYYTGYLDNDTVNGVLAQEVGAATIVLEHRYWGESSPYTLLSTANMSYLTLENSIQDLVHFANTVKLSFAKGSSTHPLAVPWVLIGGSYSGALTAWTVAKAPGTFWAALATSAVVEAISDFWQYFQPIEQGMPQTCKKDVELVIDHVDDVLMNGTAQEVHELKSIFGLADISHNDDFASAILNAPWQWQNGIELVDQWCQYVENKVNQTSSADPSDSEGVGLQRALQGYATYMRDVFIPHWCETYDYYKGRLNTDCFNTYNPNNPMYTDLSLSNTFNRQWLWFVCNEPFGWWQVSPPAGRPSIVSRLVTVEYNLHLCAMFFPTGPQGQTYGINKGRTEKEVNAFTGGWDIDNTTRLVYTNGQYDPWRPSTVSSDIRPGGPLKSTSQVPVNVIAGGDHCVDLVTYICQEYPGCKPVQDAEIKQLVTWVHEFLPSYQH